VGRFDQENGVQVKADRSLPFPVCPDLEGGVVNHYSGTSPSTSMLMARTGTYVIDQDGAVVFARVEGGSVGPVDPEDVAAVLQGLPQG
jgi:peroxiredoxin